MFRTDFANTEHRKEQMYMSEKFIRAEEVAEVMEISVAYAYKIIRKLNQEAFRQRVYHSNRQSEP